MPRSIADTLKRSLLLYWLPSDAVAEAFPAVLGGYVTILSLLRNLAVTDSVDDLNNSTLSEQPGFEEEYRYFTGNFSDLSENYTVVVSNAVLWVCREGSSSASLYTTFYILAILFIIAFHVVTAFSRFCTERFYYVHKRKRNGDDVMISIRPKKKDIILVTILSSVFFNLAILMLLLSFDISPWSCLSRPSVVDVIYSPVTNRFSIHIDHSAVAITFQQGASIVSIILVIMWIMTRVAFFWYDYGNICKRIKDENDGGKVDLQLQSLSPEEADDGN